MYSNHMHSKEKETGLAFVQICPIGHGMDGQNYPMSDFCTMEI